LRVLSFTFIKFHIVLTYFFQLLPTFTALLWTLVDFHRVLRARGIYVFWFAHPALAEGTRPFYSLS
jgi:hypothetical protein